MGIEAGQIVDEIQAQAATPVVEPTATPQETKPDDRMSGKLEILIKREQQALALEKRSRDLESSLQEKLALIARFDEAKKGNAKTALELLGMDYNQLSQSILKDGEIPPDVMVKKLEDKLSTFERERELEKQRDEENKKELATKAEARAIDNFKSEINVYLSDNKPRYELIDFEAQQELVFDVIDEHYTRTLDQATGIGKVMSIKEAADKVEEFLEKKEIKRKEVGKVKSLWGMVPKPQQDQLTKQVTFQVKPPKTLTNQMSATPRPNNPRPPEDQRVKGILAEFLAKRGQ